MDEIIVLEVKPGYGGLRADVFLALCARDMSRNAASRLLDEGRVLSSGKTLRKKDLVAEGQTIELRVPQKETGLRPEDIPLDIVYEDDDVLVINKPKGLVIHPAPGHESGTLVNALLWHRGDSLSVISGEDRPGIVHRIDKDTSGLIICAKNDFAHAALAGQISSHTARRLYDVIVRGRMKEDSGTVDAPIGRSRRDRKKMAVAPGGRDALTCWRLVRQDEKSALVLIRLVTGRTHQIRVHFSNAHHPVMGDPIYGHKGLPAAPRLMLHACALGFTHPVTQEPMVFTAMPEAAFGVTDEDTLKGLCESPL